MREMLTDTYKNTATKDPRLLQFALEHSLKSGEEHIEDLDLLEEISLTSHSSKALTELNKRAARLQSSAVNRSIALKKTLRAHLYQAKLAMKNGDFALANKELVAAKSSLKSIPALAEKQQLIFDFVSSSELLARKKGDAVRAEKLKKLWLDLHDPQFARTWYQENGIKGYDLDYSPQYATLFYVGQIYNASAPSQKTNAIRRVLELCRNKDLGRSVRATALIAVCQQKIIVDDPEFAREYLRSWAATQDKNAKPVREEADILPTILGLAEKFQENRAVSMAVLTQYISGLESGILDRKANAYFLNDFVEPVTQLGLLPVMPAEAAELLKLSTRMEKLVEGFNNGAVIKVRIIKVMALLQQEQLLEAEKTALSWLKEKGRAAAFGKPFQGQQWVYAINGTAEALQKKYGNERRRAFFDAILADPHWADSNRAQLIAAAMELERNDSKMRETTFRSMEQLLKSSGVDFEGKRLLSDCLLRDYCWAKDFARAQKFYKELKGKYASKPELLFELCLSELGWLRGFPSFSPDLHDRCLKKEFPDEMFRDGLALLPKLPFRQPENIARYKFWLAEYEMCRGDTQAALKLVREVLANKDNRATPLYLAAQCFEAEVSGHPEKLPQGRVKAPARSKIELGCLWSLLHTSQQIEASRRIQDLEKRIVEH